MLKTIKTHIRAFRWWYVGALALLLPFSIYWYRLIVSNLSAYDAIPETTGLVISIEEIGKWQRSKDTLAYGDIFSKWVLVEKCQADFKYLQPLLDENAKTILQQPVTMSIEASSAQTLDFLYIFDANWRRIDLPSLLKAREIPFKSYTLSGGHTIYNAFFNNNIGFSFATYKNLVLIARYAFMIEDALSTIDAGNGIGNISKFTKVEKAVAQKGYDCSIFLNIKALPTMLSSFLEPNRKPYLEKIYENIAWIGTGLTFSKEGIGLQGTISTTNNNALYYALPSTNFKDRQRITEVLPSNTAALFWVGAGDFQQFYNRSDTDYDFGSFIAAWVGEDAACAITEPLSEAASSEVYAVFKVKDSLLAKKKMAMLENKRGVMFELNYNMHVIKQLSHQNILHALTGSQLQLKDPYYTFIGDYAVFCSSRAALEVCIDKYLANQTLSNDALYQDFSQHLTHHTPFYCFLNVEKMDELLKSSLLPTMRPQLETQFEQLIKMNFLGIQLQPESASFSFSGKWKWTNVKKKKMNASIAWKTLLDADAAIAPAVTKAENEEGEEVFIQDIKNQIYIINGAGELRIKKGLDSKILSPIKQIDYFHNGNLYYVFNTEKKIHLLDYQGNEAQNFPLTLQSPASAGMLVADFDGAGSYHYFVPAQNGNIYGYESNGKPLGGWNPRMGIGLVKQPMAHFQVGDKDYILALTEKNLHVMRRNGEYRLSPIALEGKINSPPSFQNLPVSQRIVVGNDKGSAQNINLAGESFKVALPTGTNIQVHFLYADVWGDTRKEYITYSDKTLCIYGYEGEEFKKVSERVFQDPIKDFFIVKLPDGKKEHIGFVSQTTNQVFLMDGAGKVYKNFPLAGTTAFQVTDFFGEGVPVLIVANGASVYTYKLK
jgi:hypothetical protein